MSYQLEKILIENCFNFVTDNFLTSESIAKANYYQKGLKDVVTDIDFAVEKYIIKKIKEVFPRDTIISEEFNPNKTMTTRSWVIDPIDGTINFSLGSSIYGCQVALIENNIPVFSYIFIPSLNQRFYAIKGEGAYLNNEKLTIRSSVSLEKAVISLGSFSNKNHKLADYEHDLLKILQKGVMGVRMFGSSAFDTTCVASSKVHAHFLFTKNLWDIAPGLLICKEAGAVVTKVDGSPFQLGYPSYLLSANQNITNFFQSCARQMPPLASVLNND